MQLAHGPGEQGVLVLGVVGPDGEEVVQIDAERADGRALADVAQVVVERDTVEKQRDRDTRDVGGGAEAGGTQHAKLGGGQIGKAGRWGKRGMPLCQVIAKRLCE